MKTQKLTVKTKKAFESALDKNEITPIDRYARTGTSTQTFQGMPLVKGEEDRHTTRMSFLVEGA